MRIDAITASHSCAADSTSVLSSVCRSKVDRLMILSTSAVAVCCCSDSRSSLSRRVFSMAMAAWSAKVWSRAICRSLKRRVSEEHDRADRDTFSHQGDAEDRAVALTPRVLARDGKLAPLGLYISDVDRPPAQHRS